MRGAPTTRIDGRQALPTPGSVGPDGVLPAPSPAQGTEPVVIDHHTGTTLGDRPAGMPAYRPPSAAEVRESQRRADEAARIIEASTPEI